MMQVIFVTVNTFQIAMYVKAGIVVSPLVLAIGMVGFMISIIWAFNVRSALGTLGDKVAYASGAGFGSMIGVMLAQFLHTLL